MGKLALMNGQSVLKAFVPLPAGATAMYVGSTLSFSGIQIGWAVRASLPPPVAQCITAERMRLFGEAYAEAGTSDRSFTGQHQDTIPGSTAGLFIVALVLLAVIVTFAALHTYVTLPAAKF